MFTYRLGLLCLTDSNSAFTGYHYLVLQDWYRLKLHVSVKRTSVRWRALCVVCSCVMHCTVAVWLLLVSRALFLLSLAPGLRISIVLFFSFFFFQSIVSLKWDSVVSLWFGSVLCLTYSPFFCYACSCCCPGSGCLWGCHGGGCFVATELSILTRMLMRSG